MLPLLNDVTSVSNISVLFNEIISVIMASTSCASILNMVVPGLDRFV